jgi:hypothetical protein
MSTLKSGLDGPDWVSTEVDELFASREAKVRNILALF